MQWGKESIYTYSKKTSEAFELSLMEKAQREDFDALLWKMAQEISVKAASPPAPSIPRMAALLFALLLIAPAASANTLTAIPRFFGRVVKETAISYRDLVLFKNPAWSAAALANAAAISYDGYETVRVFQNCPVCVERGFLTRRFTGPSVSHREMAAWGAMVFTLNIGVTHYAIRKTPPKQRIYSTIGTAGYLGGSAFLHGSAGRNNARIANICRRPLEVCGTALPAFHNPLTTTTAQ